MIQVAVIYFSATDTTHQLAQAVAEGVQSQPGASVRLERIQGEDIHQGRFTELQLMDRLQQADAMIFGSPTYMGSAAAQFKAFADTTGELWSKQAWANKVAAGFTVGTNLSGDQKHTLDYFQTFANQHGMLWCGVDIPGTYDPELRNRLGAQGGVVVQTADGVVPEQDLALAFYLGQRVAGISLRLTKE
jgi:multimeric flavodoxin WrbA